MNQSLKREKGVEGINKATLKAEKENVVRKKELKSTHISNLSLKVSILLSESNHIIFQPRKRRFSGVYHVCHFSPTQFAKMNCTCLH